VGDGLGDDAWGVVGREPVSNGLGTLGSPDIVVDFWSCVDYKNREDAML